MFSEKLQKKLEMFCLIFCGCLKCEFLILNFSGFWMKLYVKTECIYYPMSVILHHFIQEWEGFELKNVTLELHDATIYTRKGKQKSYVSAADKDDKVFVAFDIDKVLARQSSCAGKPERRPFLLSRDSVSVKPTGSSIKPFQVCLWTFLKLQLRNTHALINLFCCSSKMYLNVIGIDFPYIFLTKIFG